jgi:hypothetical protein
MSFVLALLSRCSLLGWCSRTLYGHPDEEIGSALIRIRDQISPEKAEPQIALPVPLRAFDSRGNRRAVRAHARKNRPRCPSRSRSECKPNLGSLDEPCEWHNRLDLVRCGGRMTEHELMTLLSRARKVLDRYLFETARRSGQLRRSLHGHR